MISYVIEIKFHLHFFLAYIMFLFFYFHVLCLQLDLGMFFCHSLFYIFCFHNFHVCDKQLFMQLAMEI
jgi:hypothetical protein